MAAEEWLVEEEWLVAEEWLVEEEWLAEEWLTAVQLVAAIEVVERQLAAGEGGVGCRKPRGGVRSCERPCAAWRRTLEWA